MTALFETSAPAFAHPDVPGRVASFLFRREAGRLPDAARDSSLSLGLRTAVARDLGEGDFLCRAYPLDDDGRPISGLQSSWGKSPNFDAPYTYLPALSGRQLVQLAVFETDEPVAGLLLVIQAWRDTVTASDLTVDACLLRRPARLAGKASTSYTLVPPVADA